MLSALYSPYIIPLGAFAVAIVGIIMGTINKTNADKLRAEQRMALLAQGIPLADVERALVPPEQRVTHDALVRPTAAPMRTAGAIRLTALILLFSGLGMVAFFCALALLLHSRQIFSGAAVGLIPLFVGLGFLLDYRTRTREIERLRQEAHPELKPFPDGPQV